MHWWMVIMDNEWYVSVYIRMTNKNCNNDNDAKIICNVVTIVYIVIVVIDLLVDKLWNSMSKLNKMYVNLAPDSVCRPYLTFLSMGPFELRWKTCPWNGPQIHKDIQRSYFYYKALYLNFTPKILYLVQDLDSCIWLCLVNFRLTINV